MLCRSPQHTSGHQGEPNRSTVTSAWRRSFRACPTSCVLNLLHRPSSHSHQFVTIIMTWLHSCRPISFHLNRWASLRLLWGGGEPYQPRHGLSIVNLIDVCSLDLGHCLCCEALNHSPWILITLCCCCGVIVLLL